jgi:hypothetical protein
MNVNPAERLPPDPDPLTIDVASTLLQLGLDGPRRPVHGLLDRLSEAGGAAWLESALSRVCEDLGTPRELLVEGRASLEQLTTIKDRSKRLLRHADDGEASLAGVAGYFLSIAAGLRHHGALIGSRGRSELDGILLDIASVAPSPYSEMLSDATLRAS